MPQEDESYHNLYLDMLMLDEDFQEIPPLFEINPYPGESVEMAATRFLIEQGVLTPDLAGGFNVDLEAAENYDPRLKKVMQAMIDAEAQQRLDDLEAKGLIQLSVDEDGEIGYVLTDEGRDMFQWGL